MDLTNTSSFRQYLRRDRQIAWLIKISIPVTVILLTIFKYFYPRAGFLNGDSYIYLQTAVYNYNINFYPVGYSKFLRIFNTLTTNDTALVAFQYFLLQASSLYLLFTFFYYCRPGKWVRYALVAFTLFNPAYLYISNYVSSDAVFMSLSFIWFGQLIELTREVTVRRIVWHSLVIFIAFTVRYNALYYPFISALAIFLSGARWQIRTAGILAIAIPALLFVQFTSSSYKSFTGTRQFTPFTGWQLANNALYAYRSVTFRDTASMPARFAELDALVRHYFDTTRDLRTHPTEMLQANTMYMWDFRSPLQVYMKNRFKNDSVSSPFKKWSLVGPLYGEYGKWLMRRYPATFAGHFLWMNALKFYAPPLEFLDSYNSGLDSVRAIAVGWFQYNSYKVSTKFRTLDVSTLNFYPIMSGMINIIFLASILGLLTLNGFKSITTFNNILLLVAVFWGANFAFSVFSSPVTLRYQLFPLMVSTYMMLVVVDLIYQQYMQLSNKKVAQQMVKPNTIIKVGT